MSDKVENKAIELETMSQFLEQQKVDGLAVVDFWAVWCGPCKVMKPVFANSAKSFPNVRFLSVDCDVLQELPSQFEVTGIPAFFVLQFKDGKTNILGNFGGADPLGFQSKLEKILATAE